ncbi:rolling circle replication-associated protein [Vibrio cionasavignyae]|uniref:rolling circle replication-associated protein n=1 Tax=Vibrio cionasavignyae TaxID=2910252 RepID=UPI003D14FAD9
MITDNDIIYAASVVQGANKTKENIAAIESGFFESVDNSWLKHEQQKLKHFEQAHVARVKHLRPIGREAAAQAESTRLVKRRKSRTTGKHRIDRLNGTLSSHERRTRSVLEIAEISHVTRNNALYDVSGLHDNGQSRVYLMQREWSNEYKVQTVYKPSPSDAPSANDGERYTNNLTPRAVKKIFESGAYVAAAQGGFTTFLTLTFSPELREQIFASDITIGSEVSRFLNGAKKLYQRGFDVVVKGDNDNALQGHIDECAECREIEGQDTPFHYIWVAECPANDDGEPNPHVHVLLNWSVPRWAFDAWAKRIETLWGHGMANLQRIKYSEAASSYIIKAVGYAAKGGNANQGLIRGNRYNIARASRAPSWDVLASFDTDNMHAIIKECGYKLEQWKKPIERQIRHKNQQKKSAIRALDMAKGNKKPVDQIRLKRLIDKLSIEIRDEKAKIKDRGLFASSQQNFSLTFSGDDAADRLDNFLIWAAGARGWFMQSKDVPDVHELRDYAKEKYGDVYRAYLDKRCYWQALLKHDFIDYDLDYIKNEAMNERSEFCDFMRFDA